MIQIGLLGAGFIGATHAAALARLEGVQLAGVADVNRPAAEAVAGPAGARVYASADDLLADPQITAVDICLPTHLHAATVIAAAERGKDILCEKPLALSLEEADGMLAAVRRAGVRAMVAQVIRFWPEYVALRQAVDDGRIGRPLIATAHRLAAPPTWGAWFQDPAKSGGALFDLHIHDLDFVFTLFGMPRAVYALGRQGQTGGWDHVLTTLDYGEQKAVVEASYSMPPGFPFQMALRLTGDQGCLEFRFGGVGQVDQRAQALSELALYTPEAAPAFLERPEEDGYLAEIRYFVDCLRQGRAPQVATLEEARQVLRIALAARESLATRAVVQL